MIKRKTVKISRKKWLRHRSDTMMCDNQGKMCCLGFAANQVSGIPKSRMLNNSAPENVYKKPSFLTKMRGVDGVLINNSFAEKAIEINDEHTFTDVIREKKLKSLFRKNGVDLTFTD